MTAPSVAMERLRAAGVSLLRSGDALTATPKEALTDELRGLIRKNKAGLLAELDDDWGYTLADLLVMDDLINRLCDALGLSNEERAARLELRRCMAPVRIPGELAALRQVVPATEARLGVPF